MCYSMKNDPTMHTVAADTGPRLLPDIVAALVDRNEPRRTQRARAWRREGAQTRARQAAYQRFATARQQAAARERSRTKNYWLRARIMNEQWIL